MFHFLHNFNGLIFLQYPNMKEIAIIWALNFLEFQLDLKFIVLCLYLLKTQFTCVICWRQISYCIGLKLCSLKAPISDLQCLDGIYFDWWTRSVPVPLKFHLGLGGFHMQCSSCAYSWKHQGKHILILCKMY